MAKRTTRVQINSAPLNEIRKALLDNTRAFVVEMATDMEQYYRENAPRDTGSLAESVYVQMKDGVYVNGKRSSLGAVESKALSLNPHAEMEPSPTPTNETTAYIKPLVKHFAFVEYGTTRMPARPVMTQARAQAQQNLKTRHLGTAQKIATNGRRK